MLEIVKLKSKPVYAEAVYFDGTLGGAEACAEKFSHHDIKFDREGSNGFFFFRQGNILGDSKTARQGDFLIVDDVGRFDVLSGASVAVNYDSIEDGSYDVEHDFYERLIRVEPGTTIPQGYRYVKVTETINDFEEPYSETFIGESLDNIYVAREDTAKYYTFEKLYTKNPDWLTSPAIIARCKTCGPETIYVPHKDWKFNWTCTGCGMSWDWYILDDVKPLKLDVGE